MQLTKWARTSRSDLMITRGLDKRRSIHIFKEELAMLILHCVHMKSLLLLFFFGSCNSLPLPCCYLFDVITKSRGTWSLLWGHCQLSVVSADVCIRQIKKKPWDFSANCWSLIFLEIFHLLSLIWFSSLCHSWSLSICFLCSEPTHYEINVLWAACRLLLEVRQFLFLSSGSSFYIWQCVVILYLLLQQSLYNFSLVFLFFVLFSC